MAIYGIGAHLGKKHDISDYFKRKGVAGVKWRKDDAPEYYQFVSSLKVGDIVYIKSFAPSSKFMRVLGIGFVCDNEIIARNQLFDVGRNITWKFKGKFPIRKPREKNNVRLNTLYEEFHPQVQRKIIDVLVNERNGVKGD